MDRLTPSAPRREFLLTSLGSVLLSPALRPIESLVQNGWIQRHRNSFLRGAHRELRNASMEDPDIKPNTHGSGVMLKLEDQRRLYLSNDHVFCNARHDLEQRRSSLWAFDIASINPDYLTRLPEDRRNRIPEATLVREGIRNSNLPQHKVQIIGIGADLFNFVGTPFEMPLAIPSLGNAFSGRSVFCLRIKNGFLSHQSEIGGMSGSPVLLAGTGEVLGIVPSVFRTPDNVDGIVFVGPDEIRELVQMS